MKRPTRSSIIKGGALTGAGVALFTLFNLTGAQPAPQAASQPDNAVSLAWAYVDFSGEATCGPGVPKVKLLNGKLQFGGAEYYCGTLKFYGANNPAPAPNPIQNFKPVIPPGKPGPVQE